MIDKTGGWVNLNEREFVCKVWGFMYKWCVNYYSWVQARNDKTGGWEDLNQWKFVCKVRCSLCEGGV